MVDRSFDEKGELEVEKTEVIGSPSLFLRREPSFSLWCGNERVDFEYPLGSSFGTVEEDIDFDLLALDREMLGNGLVGGEIGKFGEKFGDRSRQSNASDTMRGREVYANDGRNGDSYVPFDIENTSSSELELENDVVDGFGGFGNHPRLPSSSESQVSAADVLKTLFFILVWYFFSTFLTVYNKTLLGDDLGKFPAPMLMNTVHFSMQAVLSKAITWYWSHRFQSAVAISWRDYFIRVVPTALGTALDVDLSNASLVFISVTFATMCKSGSPIFLLLFAFAFRLESPSFKLSGIIVIISLGVLLTVAKETEFEFWGFLCVMLAAVMSGFRWAMTQILLQKEAYGLKNPLALMSYVTPIMAVTTGMFSLILDPWDKFKTSNYFDSSWHVARSCFLMLFGGTLAFFMVLTEYVLVSVTSAVTVTIAGVVKEAITILVAVFYFHDEFTWLKGLGLLITMLGVGLFNWYKYEKLRTGQTRKEDLAASPRANDAAKYVILEEMDDQDDGS